MSPGQTGHITGRVPGTDGTHTRGCPAKILYVYWFFFFPDSLKKFHEVCLGTVCHENTTQLIRNTSNQVTVIENNSIRTGALGG